MTHARCLLLTMAAMLAIAGIIFLPTSAGGKECATVESVAAQIRSGLPDAEIQVIEGAQAAGIDAGIRGLTGADVADGGSYLVARAPGSQTTYVVRFAGGCATHRGRFPDDLVRAWLDGKPA